MRPRSIRARTTLVATAATAATLLVASLLMLRAVEDSLTESRDQAAQARAAQLVAALVTDGAVPAGLEVGEDEMAQVVAADGTVLAASESLGDAPAVADLAPPPGAFAMATVSEVPDDEDTETFRVWATGARGAEGPVRVYVGTSPERVHEAVAAARRSLLVGVPLVVVALAALTSWLAGRALAPVERIRSEVATISDSAPARGVPVPDTGDEVERLARTMNQMLARLEAAGMRQREFVADASHELLSPIAALRMQLDVAAAAGAEPDAALLADLDQDLTRLERLARDLLLLARAEGRDAAGRPVRPPPSGPALSGPPPADLPLVDLDAIVLDEARRLPVPPGVVLDTRGVSAAPVRGRAEDLARLVRNLLENAAAHASSRVTLTLSETAAPDHADARTVLTVVDDGPGVPPELEGRVFERFVTGSGARRVGEGTGLGLAIARALAVQHGGRLSLDGSSAAGAVFRLELPAG